MKFEQRAINIINKVLKEYGPMDWYEFKELLDEFVENEKVGSFWSEIKEPLITCSSIKLLDVEDKDGFECIDEIMRTLHYNNGKPLTTDDYNFFDHYDRDQDFWGFYEDIDIDHFELEQGELVQVVNLTYKQLRNILVRFYDGLSWEHDFGDEEEY